MIARSLMARVLVAALLVVALGGGAAAVFSYRSALHEADELFDAQLAELGGTLLAIVAHGDDDVAEDIRLGKYKYQQKLLFQVWHQEHEEWRLILRSANAPATALGDAPGFSRRDWQGKHWRLFVAADPRHDNRVLVGEDLAVRQELAGKVAWQALLPFLIAVPTLALLLLIAVRQGLGPLRRLAQDLERRSPERLDPVVLPEPPAELKPVLAELNGLLERVGAALENERRFTSDAAHELRTPLAALQAQIQAAQLTPDAGERRRALDNCLAGARRMAHLVDQLLTLARLEALPASAGVRVVDLAEVARSVCADLAPAAVENGVTLELDADDAAPLAGQEELLRVLVRNLVDNGIRYTPGGGRVRVRVAPAGEGVALSVEDTGPGVPAGDLRTLGERFHRLGNPETEGVGLGLSIVKRVAALHAAPVRFGPAPAGTGLAVVVRFPSS
ncbi:MAG TPA: ATP-binding protein [Burkholderiales bacterium]|nr:ATP-binding protein [Burkholderiales bacterium]